ncbi:beta-lactamase/transpeptidase-like protein [Dendrothele bispora CBS 962.96]|uniref:Beta-lactamase/transpeptidase-like protein n=1 Tax=Dendrothele bispora (strain CBS 962.96) TaxID=1314807 RepID=A0A4S8MYL8_DENBC|nr:beta-lactamase/transpeptidase-like protein [Dendrothele bispora CBS 962.96]
MESFRAEITTATGELGREKQTVAATVIIAGDKSGPSIQEAHGFKYLAADSEPIDLNTTFWVASLVKLMTTVAALQLVERGLVDLDEDITRVLHEWKNPSILTGFDDNGKPMTRPAQNKMTLRHLLTHSAGMGYDGITPAILKYRQAIGLSPITVGTGQTLAEMSLYPLLYEPGEGWEYSYSLDWAGVVVERLGGHGRLEDYMSSNIWSPLGIKAATFRLNEREDVRSHLLEMPTRDEQGGLKEPSWPLAPHTFAYDSGGSGLYTKPTDYAKLLAALLRNDGTLLKKETVDLMFTPQLSNPKYLIDYIKAIPFGHAMVQALPIDTDWNWGLGGMLRMKDVAGKRKARSLHWSGAPNLQWWIDRSTNVYGLYATQITPFGDTLSTDLFSRFEEAVYKETSVH